MPAPSTPPPPRKTEKQTSPTSASGHATDDAFPLWPATGAPEQPTDRRSPARVKPDRPEEVWPAPQMRLGLKPLRVGLNRSARPAQPRVHLHRRVPRRLHTGLTGLCALALLAGFMAWVSAEPFWLAVGHATTGTATVTTCKGTGLGLRCSGTFHASDGRFSADTVTVASLPRKARQAGAAVPARMVSSGGRIAYAGSDHGLYLRWLLGLVLVVLCGGGIAWVTGATRLPSRPDRLAAGLTSLVAPLLLFVGILGATW